MRFLLPLLLVVALSVGAEPVKPGYAPPFTLSDQHAAAKTVSYPTTKPTVLVVSDHSENLGLSPGIAEGNPIIASNAWASRFSTWCGRAC